MSFLDFFVENLELFKSLFEVLLLVVLFFVRGKSFSRKDKNKLLEVLQEVKYRLPDYQEKSKVSGQTFDRMKDEYVYDPDTNTLVKSEDKIDMQALIESSYETCLDSVLQRFIPQDPNLPIDKLAVMRQSKLDLMDLADLMEEAEKYRDEFGLGLDASFEDICAVARDRASKLALEIDKLSKVQQEVKEVPVDEKKEIK